jgi:hypothetical protein
MRLKFLVLALLALLLLALVAGCGGGGSSSTTAAKEPKVEERPKLSKADFIRQGDEVCAEVNTAVGSVSEAETEATSQITQVANLYVGMVQSLQGLGQPSETTGYSDFMGAAEELAKSESEVKSAAEKDNVPLLEEASQLAAPAVEEFQSQAGVYGFEECSEGPHAPVAAPEAGGVAPEETLGEEVGGVEPAPEEEIVPEEEAAPEEEVAPEEAAPEEGAPEMGGAGGEIEEVAPEEAAPEEGGESGGIGPG